MSKYSLKSETIYPKVLWLRFQDSWKRSKMSAANGLCSLYPQHFLVCGGAVPLVSRVCPSDVCRIWKSGASLRVDVTLLGFENMTWIRGRRSYIFRGDGTGASASL